jgi:putative ABC transport system permease protein
VLARLRPGTTLALAREEMSALARDLERRYPDDNLGRGVVVVPLSDDIVGEAKRALLVLFGAVVVLFAIACANVAHLELARSLGRMREVAIRAALGAGRGRLLCQSIAESLVLCLTAGALGIGLAYALVELLLGLASNLPRPESVRLDGRVLAFACAASAFATLIVAVVPVVAASRRDLQRSLSESNRAAGMSPPRQRLRQLLVVGELALSSALVIGAGLLIKSYWQLQRTDPGFEAAGLLKVQIDLPASKYPQTFTTFPRWPQVIRFQSSLLERVRALPGVQSAAFGFNHPLDPGFTTRFTIEGRPQAAPGAQDEVAVRPVSTGYFQTVGVPLLAGRLPTDADRDSPGIAVINEAMARQYFPGEDPLGRTVRFFATRVEVVGIVGNERFGGIAGGPRAALYPPLRQAPFASGSLLVRGGSEPLGLVPAIRRQIQELDRNLPVFQVAVLDTVLQRSMAEPRLNMLLLAIFAGLALLLASLGVYGLLSYSVRARSHEIGLRMALGARGGDVLAMILRRGLAWIAAGVALGVGLASGAARVMTALLFGVTATDASVYAAVTGVLLAVGLFACYIPARRATRVDPLVALRGE